MAKVAVEPGNTFVWEFADIVRTQVKVRVAGIERSEWIEPAAQDGKPTAFFVADRTVYRPGQKLQFVAFLWQENRGNEWLPLPAREAEVQLAEYRKAKVRLAIDGDRQGQTLKLKFRALDFLDKPVAGSKVSFTANVLRNPAKNATLERALDAQKFFDANNAVERVFSFDDASLDFSSNLQADGHFVAECEHDDGHTIPSEATAYVGQWFADHRRNATSEAYADGLPAVFPDWCRLP